MKMTVEHLPVQNAQLMVRLLVFQASERLLLGDDTGEIQVNRVEHLVVGHPARSLACRESAARRASQCKVSMRDTVSCQCPPFLQYFSQFFHKIVFAERVKHVVARHDIVVQHARRAQCAINLRRTHTKRVRQTAHAEGDEIQMFRSHASIAYIVCKVTKDFSDYFQGSKKIAGKRHDAVTQWHSGTVA